MPKLIAIATFLFLSTSSVFAIQGFEDAVVLNKVMNGEIVVQKIIDTDIESKMVSKSFFNKVSPEAYMDLAVSYKKYPLMFTDIKNGETLSVNSAKTEYTYKLDMLVKVGLISQHLYPEGRHFLEFAADAVSESRVNNEITNYQGYIDFGKQVVRLIPYQGGILVEDTAHFRANPSSKYASITKKKFQEFFSSFSAKFRHQLNGNY